MAGVLRLQHASVGIEAGREAEARAFYSGVLGLREKPRPIGLKNNPVIWFDAGDAEHEVHLMAVPHYVAPEGNHLCLEVDDLDAMRAQITARGITAEDAPEIDHRPRFVVKDPFGNGIELTQITGRFTPVDE